MAVRVHIPGLCRMSESGSGAEPQTSPDHTPSRVAVTESEAATLSAPEWASRWRQQDTYVTALERRLALQEGT